MGRLVAGVLVLVGVVVCGCGGGHGGSGSPSGTAGTGKVGFHLTDAPAALPASLSGLNTTLTGITLTGPSGSVPVFQGSQTFNLLQLQNGNVAPLVSALVPVGFYNQVVVTMSSATLQLSGAPVGLLSSQTGAGTFTVTLPSQITVTNGSTLSVVIDVNVAQSLTPQAGAPGGFAFNPTGRVVVLTGIGEIQGTVTDLLTSAPIPGALVTATLSGTASGAAVTASDGTYAIVGLLPGTYDVTAEAQGYQPSTSAGEAVSAGSVAFVFSDASSAANLQITPSTAVSFQLHQY